MCEKWFHVSEVFAHDVFCCRIPRLCERCLHFDRKKKCTLCEKWFHVSELFDHIVFSCRVPRLCEGCEYFFPQFKLQHHIDFDCPYTKRFPCKTCNGLFSNNMFEAHFPCGDDKEDETCDDKEVPDLDLCY